ncbi:hypothetical protein JCGZ_05998 [Jatropha curcas]|uniref:SET domain-containing protein n=1 Tax=Jatropha curcas TaxID=180498 RepID=A0A067L0D8_JATCU|nr:uncharacterized protein LOC105634581 [Jatropha curcas]KDP37559.1 hypothetical protein JCGZ_05998 [Jatropha curcas]
MAFLFNKFQEAVKILAKSPTFARDPRQMQFEADINRLFLYTSYNRLGRNAEEADAEEIIELASKASVVDQQKQIQENIHFQIKNFCLSMDEILLPNLKKGNNPGEALAQSNTAPRRSGLSFAVGKSGPATDCLAIPETRPLKSAEVSRRLKDLIGYTLDLKPSKIPHKEAGQGLFVEGEADVGTVIALYPGVIYSPAYYRYIPGYPRVDSHNTYLITRYDGNVINAQPWGFGGETREMWNGSIVPQIRSDKESGEKGLDRFWKMISKPVEGTQVGGTGEILERRNPLALAHFANHPAKGMAPNVMICPYDFPLTEKDLRAYIPNITLGNSEEVNMRRFGSFWFRSRGKDIGSDVPVLKTLVLVATRALCDEEVLLNYRLSNTKRRPEWYSPVDEEEDRRRWS